MGRGHGPGPLHPPDREGVAEPLVSHIAAACHLGVQLVALEDLVEEVDVPGRQLEGLNLAQLVRGQRWDDLPQRGERLVQRLGALALPHVGHDPLRLQLLVRLRAPAAAAAAAAARAAAAAARRLLAALALGRTARLVAASDAPARGSTGPRAAARAAPAATPLSSPALAARRLLPVWLFFAVAQAVVGRRDWRAGHVLHHLSSGDAWPRGPGAEGQPGEEEESGAPQPASFPSARRRPGRCGPRRREQEDGREGPPRGGRAGEAGREAGGGGDGVDGPEVQKESAQRLHAHPAWPPGNGAGAAEPARCLGVGRELQTWRLLYLRAGGKFGGSSVIGLTWGGGTFRSFIGKFPLSSPPPPSHLPSSGSNNSSSQTIQKRPGPGGRPLHPPPTRPPPSLPVAFPWRARGDFLPRWSVRAAPLSPSAAQEAAGGDCPGRGGSRIRSGCDSSNGNSFYTVGDVSSRPRAL